MRWLEILRHSTQTLTLLSAWKQCPFFLCRVAFLTAVSSPVVLKERNPHLPLKERPSKARPSPLPWLFSLAAASRPHLQCVEDVMVRCYFPSALLLRITACDCDKWIFPLNSLVEWDIPLTIGTIPTEWNTGSFFFSSEQKVREKTKDIL